MRIGAVCRTLPPSPLELAEKLEQLRALEAGMTIAVTKIHTAPAGVDTAEDLEAARMRGCRRAPQRLTVQRHPRKNGASGR